MCDSSESAIARAGLQRIARLYAIEEKIRGEPPATRQAVRWTEAAPLVNGFGVWLDEQRSRVSPRSRLGEKLTYIANQWDGLLAFLYDGRVEIDTNFVENRIRPVKLTAKNALFAGHDEGAAAWGRVASLIETCKMNGVEPYALLKSTLEKIAAGHPQSRIHQLLPWNFEPATDAADHGAQAALRKISVVNPDSDMGSGHRLRYSRAKRAFTCSPEAHAPLAFERGARPKAPPLERDLLGQVRGGIISRVLQRRIDLENDDAVARNLGRDLADLGPDLGKGLGRQRRGRVDDDGDGVDPLGTDRRQVEPLIDEAAVGERPAVVAACCVGHRPRPAG